MSRSKQSCDSAGYMWQIKCHTRTSSMTWIAAQRNLCELPSSFDAAFPATLTSKRLAGSRLYCWLLSSSCSPSRLQSVPSNGSEISVLRKHKGKYCHKGNLHRCLQKAQLSSLPKGCLCLNLILKTKSPLSAWVYAIKLGLIPEYNSPEHTGDWADGKTNETIPLLRDVWFGDG